APLDVGGDTLPFQSKEAAEFALPGYEVLEVLGRGGMGVVYMARDESLNRLVAIKTISGHAFDQPATVARFRREAEILARISHSNIVQIYQVVLEQGRACLVMEYLDGGTLSQRIAGQPQPAEQCATTMELLARAVAEAHKQQIIHRDLKPQNVLLTASAVP